MYNPLNNPRFHPPRKKPVDMRPRTFEVKATMAAELGLKLGDWITFKDDPRKYVLSKILENE